VTSSLAGNSVLVRLHACLCLVQGLLYSRLGLVNVAMRGDSGLHSGFTSEEALFWIVIVVVFYFTLLSHPLSVGNQDDLVLLSHLLTDWDWTRRSDYLAHRLHVPYLFWLDRCLLANLDIFSLFWLRFYRLVLEGGLLGLYNRLFWFDGLMSLDLNFLFSKRRNSSIFLGYFICLWQLLLIKRLFLLLGLSLY